LDVTVFDRTLREVKALTMTGMFNVQPDEQFARCSNATPAKSVLLAAPLGYARIFGMTLA
jgi:hypothetical protein